MFIYVGYKHTTYYYMRMIFLLCPPTFDFMRIYFYSQDPYLTIHVYTFIDGARGAEGVEGSGGGA